MARKPKNEAYQSYEGFLRAAIKEYWDSGQASRVNFLALLLASREAWAVAWEGVAGSGKTILTGAAGAAALALLLRTVVGGPIGILLTGATIASLVAVYVRNHRRIWKKVERYRELLDGYRSDYEQVRTDYVDGVIRRDQRDLMMDGLMSRLLVALDEVEVDGDDDIDDEDQEVPEDLGEFARHAARRRAEEGEVSEREHDRAGGADEDEGR